MTEYTDTIRRWAIDLRRSGPLEDPDGVGEVGLGAREAGRRLAVRFAIRVDRDLVDTVRFEVFGCGFTIAACAAAAELTEGRSLETVLALTAEDIDETLGGLPSERGYCAELAIEGLQAAVRSGRGDNRTVRTGVALDQAHEPRVDAANPIYSGLMNSPAPSGIAKEDRHLFACLIASAAQDPHGLARGLGLSPEELDALLDTYFPATDHRILEDHTAFARTAPPEGNDDVRDLLLSHLPLDGSGRAPRSSRWLASIVAARAAHPGHLWIAMGLFERPELTASIRRHLPSLAAANDRGMRWKRYLFKRVCDLGGGIMCKAPNCGECSDYTLCFATEDG